MTPKPRVTIYIDGSCEPNPGPGGWAAILRAGSKEKIITGTELNSTNNRMELTAAVAVLNALKQPSQVDLFTDSQYLQRGITKWLDNWRARNWKRKGGKLANPDLWRDLDSAIQRHKIDWHWVRAHAGNPDNERVDKLARKAMKSAR